MSSIWAGCGWFGIKPAEPGASAPKPKDQLKEKLLKGLFK